MSSKNNNGNSLRQWCKPSSNHHNDAQRKPKVEKAKKKKTGRPTNAQIQKDEEEAKKNAEKMRNFLLNPSTSSASPSNNPNANLATQSNPPGDPLGSSLTSNKSPSTGGRALAAKTATDGVAAISEMTQKSKIDEQKNKKRSAGHAAAAAPTKSSPETKESSTTPRTGKKPVNGTADKNNANKSSKPNAKKGTPGRSSKKHAQSHGAAVVSGGAANSVQNALATFQKSSADYKEVLAQGKSSGPPAKLMAARQEMERNAGTLLNLVASNKVATIAQEFETEAIRDVHAFAGGGLLGDVSADVKWRELIRKGADVGILDCKIGENELLAVLAPGKSAASFLDVKSITAGEICSDSLANLLFPMRKEDLLLKTSVNGDAISSSSATPPSLVIADTNGSHRIPNGSASISSHSGNLSELPASPNVTATEPRSPAGVTADLSRSPSVVELIDTDNESSSSTNGGVENSVSVGQVSTTASSYHPMQATKAQFSGAASDRIKQQTASILAIGKTTGASAAEPGANGNVEREALSPLRFHKVDLSKAISFSAVKAAASTARVGIYEKDEEIRGGSERHSEVMALVDAFQLPRFEADLQNAVLHLIAKFGIELSVRRKVIPENDGTNGKPAHEELHFYVADGLGFALEFRDRARHEKAPYGAKVYRTATVKRAPQMKFVSAEVGSVYLYEVADIASAPGSSSVDAAANGRICSMLMKEVLWEVVRQGRGSKDKKMMHRALESLHHLGDGYEGNEENLRGAGTPSAPLPPIFCATPFQHPPDLVAKATPQNESHDGAAIERTHQPPVTLQPSEPVQSGITDDESPTMEMLSEDVKPVPTKVGGDSDGADVLSELPKYLGTTGFNDHQRRSLAALLKKHGPAGNWSAYPTTEMAIGNDESVLAPYEYVQYWNQAKELDRCPKTDCGGPVRNHGLNRNSRVIYGSGRMGILIMTKAECSKCGLDVYDTRNRSSDNFLYDFKNTVFSREIVDRLKGKEISFNAMADEIGSAIEESYFRGLERYCRQMKETSGDPKKFYSFPELDLNAVCPATLSAAAARAWDAEKEDITHSIAENLLTGPLTEIQGTATASPASNEASASSSSSKSASAGVNSAAEIDSQPKGKKTLKVDHTWCKGVVEKLLSGLNHQGLICFFMIVDSVGDNTTKILTKRILEYMKEHKAALFDSIVVDCNCCGHKGRSSPWNLLLAEGGDLVLDFFHHLSRLNKEIFDRKRVKAFLEDCSRDMATPDENDLQALRAALHPDDPNATLDPPHHLITRFCRRYWNRDARSRLLKTARRYNDEPGFEKPMFRNLAEVERLINAHTDCVLRGPEEFIRGPEETVGPNKVKLPVILRVGSTSINEGWHFVAKKGLYGGESVKTLEGHFGFKSLRWNAKRKRVLDENNNTKDSRIAERALSVARKFFGPLAAELVVPWAPGAAGISSSGCRIAGPPPMGGDALQVIRDEAAGVGVSSGSINQDAQGLPCVEESDAGGAQKRGARQERRAKRRMRLWRQCHAMLELGVDEEDSAPEDGSPEDDPLSDDEDSGSDGNHDEADAEVHAPGGAEDFLQDGSQLDDLSSSASVANAASPEDSGVRLGESGNSGALGGGSLASGTGNLGSSLSGLTPLHSKQVATPGKAKANIQDLRRKRLTTPEKEVLNELIKDHESLSRNDTELAKAVAKAYSHSRKPADVRERSLYWSDIKPLVEATRGAKASRADAARRGPSTEGESTQVSRALYSGVEPGCKWQVDHLRTMKEEARTLGRMELTECSLCKKMKTSRSHPRLTLDAKGKISRPGFGAGFGKQYCPVIYTLEEFRLNLQQSKASDKDSCPLCNADMEAHLPLWPDKIGEKYTNKWKWCPSARRVLKTPKEAFPGEYADMDAAKLALNDKMQVAAKVQNNRKGRGKAKPKKQSSSESSESSSGSSESEESSSSDSESAQDGDSDPFSLVAGRKQARYALRPVKKEKKQKGKKTKKKEKKSKGDKKDKGGKGTQSAKHDKDVKRKRKRSDDSSDSEARGRKKSRRG